MFQGVNARGSTALVVLGLGRVHVRFNGAPVEILQVAGSAVHPGVRKVCLPRRSQVDTTETASADAAQAKDTVSEIRQRQARANREVQQQAAQTADAASQTAAQIEQRVAEMHRQGSQWLHPTEQGHHPFTPHEPGESELIGLLEGSGLDWLSIRDGSGFEYVIKTNSQTRMIGPHKTELPKLRQGAQLSVGFIFQGKDRVARDIEVLAPHPPDASLGVGHSPGRE